MNKPPRNQMGDATGGQADMRLEGHSQPFDDQASSVSLNDVIVESINHALIVLDESFRVVRHNRRFLEIFQITSVEESGFSLKDALPDNRLATIIKQSVESEDSVHEVEFSCQIDDHERQFIVSTSWIDLPSSERGILVTFNEITEWKRHQAQVMEASRLVSIGEMAAGIAHEVNNPLAAVMGFTQLAMRRNEDSSVSRDLDKILAESKRASKIITNLQSFARRYKPNKANVDIGSVIQKVLEFRSYELDVNNVTVDVSMDSELPYVLGDEHQIEQVILNLVINAEYFMSDANAGGTLKIEAARKDDKVSLSFSDDGPGIDTEHLPKIFDPFFTTKEVGKGTGLGLSICYGIIHEHDGTITVDSEVGRGTTFTIELPASTQNESMAPSFDPKRYLSERRENLNILIVDDEPGVSEVVSRALSEQGHTVDTAESGSEVIQKGNLDKYDVFILDIKMPGIGGAALYEHIEGVSGELSSRVMFTTGDTTNPATKEFIDQTSSPLLTKPFTIEELVSTVNRFASTQSPAYLEESK